MNEPDFYYSQGITPIPCKPGSKIPTVAWGEYQYTLPPRHLLRQWFCVPRNIALVTGGHGHLVVLDFDDLDRYHDWSGPRTRTVSTSRGVHAYFYSVKPSSSYKLDGLDVLADRSLVMAPPSIHPSGCPYEAIDDAPIAVIRNVSDVVEIALPTPPISITKRESRATRGSTGVVDTIKTSIPIIALLSHYTRPLQSSRDGRYYVMACPHPGHDDRNPSFWCDTYLDVCGCYVCGGRAKDVIGLFAWVNGITNTDAIKELSRYV